MKAVVPLVALIATTWLPEVVSQQGFYINRNAINNVRQGSLREYLPPSNTQKPRPFEPPTQATHRPPEDENNIFGYPPSGSITPQPPFPVITSPVTGGITGGGYPSPNPEIIPPDNRPGFNGYPRPDVNPQPGFPTSKPGYPATNYPEPGYPSTPGEAVTYPGVPGRPEDHLSTTGQPGTYIPPIAPGYTPSQPPVTYPTEGSTYSPSPFPTAPPTYAPPTAPPTYSPSPFPTAPPTYSPSPFPTAPPIYTPFPTAPPTLPPYDSSTTPPIIKEPPPQTYPPATSPSEPFPPATSKPEPYPPATSPPETYPPATNPPEVHTSAPLTYPITYPSPTDKYQTSPPKTYPTFRPSESPTSKIEESTYTFRPVPSEGPTDSHPTESEYATSQPPKEEDLKHPPHIHAIDVECAKDMMTINIEFNRQFDGVIYSKGFYNQPECRYVKENSGQTKFSFTVSLNSCGTEFINAFDTQGQSYLENVLVLQNEIGIQEVWDTIRSVRCLWEGNLNKALSVSLSVGMLTQEIVTFSGDTAVARLDIQLGRGPFAPTANGLVKIGEQMTLVVSVTGDPGFDIQVKDCVAKDSSGDNEVVLTDESGCILKPKLFGAFQKTRNTENTGASVIAYAFFNAFKFPDIMDLMIECNVELCKTDCDVCPNPDQKLEPGRRRRRDTHSFNGTLGEPVRIGKILRVLLPEDLSNGEAIINIKDNEGICMSVQGFFVSSVLLISLLTATSLFSAYLWLNSKRCKDRK